MESLADVVVTIESPNDLVPDESNKRHRRRAVSHPVCTDGTVVESPNHHNNKAASQNFSDSGIGIEDSVHQHRTTDMSFSQSNCAIDSGDRFASPVRTTTVL